MFFFFASFGFRFIEHRFCIVFGAFFNEVLDRPFGTMESLRKTRIRKFRNSFGCSMMFHRFGVICSIMLGYFFNSLLKSIWTSILSLGDVLEPSWSRLVAPNDPKPHFDRFPIDLNLIFTHFDWVWTPFKLIRGCFWRNMLLLQRCFSSVFQRLVWLRPGAKN